MSVGEKGRVVVVLGGDGRCVLEIGVGRFLLMP